MDSERPARARQPFRCPGRSLPCAALLAVLVACGGGPAPLAGSPAPPTTLRTASVTVGEQQAGALHILVSTIVDASWESWLFQRWPGAATRLEEMGQQHMLIVLDENAWEPVIPQIGRDPASPDAWDFTRLDAIVQPMLAMGDHSPVFMVAAAPPHMYDAGHKLVDLPAFATYASNLVRYYNGPGITLSDGTTLRSVSPHPIQYWSILNETNLSGTEYRALYDRVVPAMQAVDSTLELIAAEIAWGNERQVNDFLVPFLRDVRAPVDVLGIHFFPAGQQDPDQKVFDYVPECARNVGTLYELLGRSPRLADVPVWITSYNSTSWGPLDVRPTSTFYAAWAPYLFSRVARAGARSFHHWEFAANAQFGEIDQESGRPYISYWVDAWLARLFSAPAGQELLTLSAQSDATNIETLAVRRADGEVVVMIVDHAVADPADNNGQGISYTVEIDVESLGTFTRARELTIDSTTDLTAGPVERDVPLADQLSVALQGYGVAFLRLLR